MTFERTTDMSLVREIMTNTRVYPFITDDGSPDVRDFQPLNHPAIWYMLALDGEDLLGLWMFVPTNSVCCEVHTCLLPGHGFRRARTAARGMAEWMWANTGVHRIFTSVPACNRVALRFAEEAGMEWFGMNPASFAKHGKLWDQVLLGMSRPKEQECQQL